MTNQLLRPAALLSLTTLTLAACAPSMATLQQRAAAGEAQADAPLLARHDVQVDAPPEAVWRVLADVARWPAWHPAVRQAAAPGPLAPGVSFSWNNEGTEIRSTVAAAQAPSLLAWTGTASVAKAVHVWRLTPSAGGTRVSVEESMDGPLLAWLYPQAKLDAAVTGWLADLKVEAERRAGRP